MGENAINDMLGLYFRYITSGIYCHISTTSIPNKIHHFTCLSTLYRTLVRIALFQFLKEFYIGGKWLANIMS